MTMMENGERAERRARQRELADRLKASGALDQIFEQIDGGEVPLGGDDGLLKGMVKAALERGLEVELTDHVGYERGDPDASLFPNSRNGTTAKTVSSEVGEVELAIPRDRNGSFTPQLLPKGSRRLGGLDEMIISLYAGGMTLRDIQYHLVSTIGTELSHETISKITDQVAEEVLIWQRRPLEPLYPVIYLDALVVKVKDGAHVRNKAAHIAVGVDVDGIKHVLGMWVQTSEGAKFLGRGMRRAGQPRRQGCADRVLRRAHRFPRGDRGDLAELDSPNLICPRLGWREGPAGHLRRLGQDLCKRVAFEVQRQTCPAGAMAGLVSASGSSADLSAEMRFRRGRSCEGGAGSEEAHIVMSNQDHLHVDQQFFGGVDWGGSFHQLCVLNTSGALVLQQRINHDVAGLRLLAARIADLGALVSVAIERGEGLLVEFLHTLPTVTL